MKPETHCNTCNKKTLTNDEYKCVVCKVVKLIETIYILDKEDNSEQAYD